VGGGGGEGGGVGGGGGGGGCVVILLVVRGEAEYPSGYPLIIKASLTCSSTSVLSLANVHKRFAVRCNVQQPYGQ